MTRSYNVRLQPLPDDLAILTALDELQEERPYRYGATAQAIAGKLGVQGSRRLGRGAVKGSWTGNMAPALRISPRLRYLRKRGLIRSWYDTDNYRHTYVLSAWGNEVLKRGEVPK